MAAAQELPQELAHEDKGPMVLAVCIALTTVATIFVAARLYVRCRILSMMGLDDWLIILSMVSAHRSTRNGPNPLTLRTDVWLHHAWPHYSSCAGWQRASLRSALR